MSVVARQGHTLLVLLTAGLHVRRERRPQWPGVFDPVTVIVPAYNEAAGIEATIRSVLASRRGLPYLLLFQVVLPVLAPVVDVAGLFGVLTGAAVTSVVTWLAFLALQMIPGVVAFRLDRERLGPLLVLPLQQFAYRQLMYLVVVQSVATAVAGARLPWQKLERHGQAVPVD